MVCLEKLAIPLQRAKAGARQNQKIISERAVTKMIKDLRILLHESVEIFNKIKS